MVDRIYNEVQKLGISIYKNYLDRKSWLLVEMGKVVIEIACGDTEVYVFAKKHGESEHKVYKKVGWLVKYIKKEFEKELQRAMNF